MPPHCDTLDGPVVKAAQKALARGTLTTYFRGCPKKLKLN